MAPSQKVLEAFNTPIKTQVNQSVFTPGSSDKSQKVLDAFNKAENVQTSAPVENSAVSNNRAANILGAAGQGTASGFVNAAGMMAEGGIKANEAQNAAAIADLETRIADQQRMLDNAKKAGVLSAKDEESYINTITALQTQLDAYKGAGGAWEGSTQAAYQYADQLSQESALKQEAAKQGLGTLGQFGVDVGIGAAQLAGDIVVGAITGTGKLPLFVRAAGSAGQEARQRGATYGQQVAYGLGVGAIEAATERISSIGGVLTKWAGKGVADNLTEQAIKSAVERLAKTDRGKAVLTTIANMGVSGVGEGFEEIIAGAIEPVLQKATYNPDAKWNWEDIIYEGLVALPIGAIVGGVPVNRTQAATPSQTENQPAQQVQNNPVMNVSSAQAKAPAEAENLSLLAQRDAANAILGSSIGREYVKNTYGNETNFRNAVKEANPQLNDVQAYVVMANEVKSNLANNTYTDKNAVKEQARIAKLPQLPNYVQEKQMAQDTQYSIVPEGNKKIVVVDNPDVSTKLSDTEKEMLSLFKNLTGENAVISENDNCRISVNRRAVKEFLRSDYVQTLSKDLKNVVYVTGRQLDELIKASEPALSYENTDPKHTKDASLGWEHREVIFESPVTKNGKTQWKRFNAMLIVRKNNMGNYSHGIIGIQKKGPAAYGMAHNEAAIKSAEPSFDTKISQKSDGVNRNFMQNGENNTQRSVGNYDDLLNEGRSNRSVGERAGEQTGSIQETAGSSTQRRAEAQPAGKENRSGNDGNVPEGRKRVTIRNRISIAPVMLKEETQEMSDIRKRAKELGLKDVVFMYGYGTDLKTNEEFRGAYDSESKTVYIQVDNSEATIEQIFQHESYHYAVDKNPKLVRETIAKIRERYPDNQELQSIYDLYADAYTSIYGNSKYKIFEEVLADAYAGLNSFTGSEIVEADMMAKNDVAKNTDSLEEIQEELLDEGVEIVDDSAVKYSLKTWTKAEEDRVRKALIKSDYDRADVDKWIGDVNGVASIIAADQDRLDYAAADNQEMFKKNQEYKYTLDSSTLCAKRLLYQGTFNAIQHRLPNTVLTSDDLIEISTYMKEKGLETPCGVCYVESRRRHLGRYAQKWLDSYEGQYKPTLAEVTTSDGLEELRKAHPDTYADFIAAMNKIGTNNPKVVELRTAYRGEIKRLTAKTVQDLNNAGGLIVQSFSDFETPHLIDMMQAVLDMSAKGLKSQAYTKVPNFAWAFGDTGIKINLSLIAEGNGLDANGKLIFSSSEGIDFDEAMRLRNAYPDNVGTIIVGVNDQHILAAMADDRIDYIIPFHKSGWGKKELTAFGMQYYKDYTKMQNERSQATGKKVKKNLSPKDYWDYSKTGKQNAERYLKLCHELNRIPKFDNFLVKNADGSYSLQPDGSTDGYWKTLIDFKMYNNDGEGVPQKVVTPKFNMQEAKRILEEYEGGADTLPVAEDVVEHFVEKFGKNKSSLRMSVKETPNVKQDVKQLIDIANEEPPADTNLPNIKPKEAKKGDRESAFPENLKGASIFDERFKDLVVENSSISSYNAIANKDTMQEALLKLDKEGADAVEKFRNKNPKNMSAVDIAMGFILMHRYQAVGNYEGMIAITQKLREAGTAGGQTVQMFSILGRMTPDGMVYYAQKELSKAWDEVVKGKTRQWAEEHKDDYKLTEEEIESIVRDVSFAAQLPNGRDRNILLAGVSRLIADKIQKTGGQQLKAWARISMLLNPKTQVRNVLGNAIIMPQYIVSDFIGSAIDKKIAKTTNVRTTGTFSKSALAGMKKGFYESFDDFRRGINTRNMDGDRFEIGQGKIFNDETVIGRALNALDRTLSFLLDAGDRTFYETWFINSLNNQMRLNNATEPTAHMIEIATQDALQRTWQDENAYTKTVSKLREAMNSINIKGYGLGDAIMPFVKTPSNLTKAIIDFSPIGLINALARKSNVLKTAIDNGEYTPLMQREYVNAVSKGITGTMMMVIYYCMAALGWLTGGEDEDKDVAYFEKNIMGIAPYSFRIGDTSVSYDWMQPAGSTAAMMANVYQVINEGALSKKFSNNLGDNAKNAFNLVIAAMKTAGDLVVSQSFMKGVMTLFGYDGLWGGLFTAVLGEPSKFTPTIVSQIASATDDTARTSYVYGNDVQTAINKVLYKIPGARKGLEPIIDQLGRETKNADTAAARAFNSFLNPAIVRSKNSNKAAEEMYRLYEETGEASAIPPVAEYYFNVDKERNIMTAEERTKYQKVFGQEAVKQVGNALNSSSYKKLSDAEKVDIVEDIYSYAKALARAEVSDYKLAGNDAKAAEAEAKGIAAATYFIYKATGDLNGNGSINQEEAKKALDKLPLTKAQKATLWQLTNSQWSVKNNPYR